MRVWSLTTFLIAALALLAAPAAHADERSAKWVGRWTFATQYTATPGTLTLKESGGKMTGDIDSRPLGIALFKGDALRMKFDDVFGAGYDCTISLRADGAEFAGNCYYFHHGREERQSVTGVRQK
ncbi:MAG: hypothetical protein ACREHE_15160 [Rhizomicrobium sp.]